MKTIFTFEPKVSMRLRTKLLPLSSLPKGCSAVIATVDPSATELMELGFVPGVRITPKHGGFRGDPRVYEVDGSLVALRRSAARHISVRLLDESEKEGD